jgi:hypothetical protein
MHSHAVDKWHISAWFYQYVHIYRLICNEKLSLLSRILLFLFNAAIVALLYGWAFVQDLQRILTFKQETTQGNCSSNAKPCSQLSTAFKRLYD